MQRIKTSLHSHPITAVRLTHPGRSLLESRSLEVNVGHCGVTASIIGAILSSVIRHFAWETCKRWRMSLAVSWDVPGIRTVPVGA